MKSIHKDQNGSHLLLIIFALLLIAAVGFVGWRVYSSKSSKTSSSNNAEFPKSDTKSQKVTWMQTENGWEPSGTPPACPSPLVYLPVDITKVTSILYPGQYRGGEYKPHGGFRFDNNTDNNVKVVAMLDAELVRGARYPVNGELQYVFDFIAPCGYMYRLGHLLTLSPTLQAVADKLPLNNEGDSRDTRVKPSVPVKAGDVLATAVGVSKGGVNAFFDWGVYDLRTKNEASKDSAWAAVHIGDTEQHAVCWFDLLSADEEAKVRALPASDSKSGKTSDYCK